MTRKHSWSTLAAPKSKLITLARMNVLTHALTRSMSSDIMSAQRMWRITLILTSFSSSSTLSSGWRNGSLTRGSKMDTSASQIMACKYAGRTSSPP